MAGTPPPSNNGDWKSSLPIEYQQDKGLEKFKDVGSLVKSYKDLEGFMSTATRVPKEGDKPEQWDSFYKAWGRPEKPDAYKFPDGIPKDFQPPDELKGKINAAAHSIGLNQKQYESLLAWGATESKNILEAEQTQMATAEKALRDEWGFRYDSNKERAVRTIAFLADMKKDNPFVQWLESTGNDRNPVILKFFHEISGKLGEDDLVSETQQRITSESTEAQKRINEVMADHAGPYYNERDPRHQDSVNEVARLYKIITPE